MDFYKARVVYGKQGVEAVEYAPYFIRNTIFTKRQNTLPSLAYDRTWP